MIFAGIDEAGLGPKLGPLITASFAMSCPDNWDPSSPWRELPNIFTDKPSRKKNCALPVCDSKILHPVGGTAALELTVGALYNTVCPEQQAAPATPEPIVMHPGKPVHPCYDAALSPFPLHCNCNDIVEKSSVLRDALSDAKVTPDYYAVHVLYEPAFNGVLDAGLNKNQLLLEQTGNHLTALVEKFGKEDSLFIVVDKQGGRNSYAPYLASLFPGEWPVEMEAGRERSLYHIRCSSFDAMISFQAKADRYSFFTAAASLAAKYVRERSMLQLNTWFSERFTELKPTAGYPQDAKRWLEELAGLGGVRKDDLQLDLLIRKK